MYDVVNAAGQICFSMESVEQAEAMVALLNSREDRDE